MRDIILPDEKWQLVAEGCHDARGPACNAGGEVFFVDTADNKICRIDLDGKVKVFLSDAGQASSLSFGPEGQLYAVSSTDGEDHAVMTRRARAALSPTAFAANISSPCPKAASTSPARRQARRSGRVWFVKDGKKTLVDSGLKFATGLAYRPDQWLLSVADGHSKWVYSYQINADGTLANKERFFWLHVADWDDDAGAESVCFAKEGRMFVATRWGIQIAPTTAPRR